MSEQKPSEREFEEGWPVGIGPKFHSPDPLPGKISGREADLIVALTAAADACEGLASNLRKTGDADWAVGMAEQHAEKIAEEARQALDAVAQGREQGDGEATIDDARKRRVTERGIEILRQRGASDELLAAAEDEH